MNSSISAYVQRQQTIWNDLQEEEKLARQNEKRDYFIKKSFSNQQNTVDKSQRQPSVFYRDKNQPVNFGKKSNKYYAIESGNRRNRKIQAATEEPDDDDSGSDSDDYKLEKLEIPNWSETDLIEINKDFYKPSKLTESRSAECIREFYSTKHIKIKSNVVKPIFKFNELNDLPQKMMIELEKLGFVDCAPIQSQGIPVALSGANILGISHSG